MNLPETMNAVYYVDDDVLEVREVSMPKLENDTDVLVKTKAVGICGSDLTAFHGKHPAVTRPSVPGHEFVGEVIAVGSAVTNVSVGDHVVRAPIDFCGKCYACTHGRPNVCKDLSVWGFAHDGGQREYFVSDCSKLFKFDKHIAWKHAAMIEPFTIAAECNDRAEVIAGDTVLIYGLGPIGIAIGVWAKRIGATVMGCDLLPSRIDMAKECGFDYAWNSREVDVDAEIMKITKGEGVNVLMEATGVKGLLDGAAEKVSPAGRILPVSFIFEDAKINYGLLNAKEIKVCSSRLAGPQQFEVVADAIREIEPAMKRMVTQEYPYQEVQAAFEKTASRDEDVCKIVVTYY